jgi:hypothetical protein
VGREFETLYGEHGIVLFSRERYFLIMGHMEFMMGDLIRFFLGMRNFWAYQVQLNDVYYGRKNTLVYLHIGQWQKNVGTGYTTFCQY